MASRIPDEFVGQVEPSGDGSVHPSSERIKQLALQKRSNYLRKEEKPMKKAPLKILLVAAIVVALSFSAFAAFGGIDYLRGIFGDSIDSIQDQVVTPLVKGSADGREMAVEALVTDGYVTNLIVSLTGDEPVETQPFATKSEDKVIEKTSTMVVSVDEEGDPYDSQLFLVTFDSPIRSYGWSKLEAFSMPGKTYYAIDLLSEQRFDKANIGIALNRDVADIALTLEIENNLGNAVVGFPAGAKSGQTRLMGLQISPMGFMLTGSEDNPEGGLPPTSIQVVFANKKIETMDVQFADGEGGRVAAGGGAIMTEKWQKGPLVTKFFGVRNPDGEIVITGQFSRIINPAEIVKVVVDGVEYPVG